MFHYYFFIVIGRLELYISIYIYIFMRYVMQLYVYFINLHIIDSSNIFNLVKPLRKGVALRFMYK